MKRRMLVKAFLQQTPSNTGILAAGNEEIIYRLRLTVKSHREEMKGNPHDNNSHLVKERLAEGEEAGRFHHGRAAVGKPWVL